MPMRRESTSSTWSSSSDDFKYHVDSNGENGSPGKNKCMGVLAAAGAVVIIGGNLAYGGAYLAGLAPSFYGFGARNKNEILRDTGNEDYETEISESETVNKILRDTGNEDYETEISESETQTVGNIRRLRIVKSRTLRGKNGGGKNEDDGAEATYKWAAEDQQPEKEKQTSEAEESCKCSVFVAEKLSTVLVILGVLLFWMAYSNPCGVLTAQTADLSNHAAYLFSAVGSALPMAAWRRSRN